MKLIMDRFRRKQFRQVISKASEQRRSLVEKLGRSKMEVTSILSLFNGTVSAMNPLASKDIYMGPEYHEKFSDCVLCLFSSRREALARAPMTSPQCWYFFSRTRKRVGWPASSISPAFSCIDLTIVARCSTNPNVSQAPMIRSNDSGVLVDGSVASGMPDVV